MRIVLLHYSPTGANPVYAELASALRLRGHKVYVAWAGDDGALEFVGGDGLEKRIAGIAAVPKPWSRMPLLATLLARWQLLRFIARIRQALVDLSPNIVQINPLSMSELVPPLMPGGIHFVLDIRQINEAVNPRLATRLKETTAIFRRKFWAKHVFEKTCFCHAEAAKRILGSDWQKWGAVVPVGVDQAFIDHPANERGRGKNDPVSFVYVGTLSRLRNLENIMRAAKLLLRHTDKFRIDFIGPDKSNGYYSGVIEELGIESCVMIKPPVAYSEVPSTLVGYDVGLAYTPDRPTWHYQPTIKVLEYRALGMPIISTDVASHRETVENGVNGLLCGDGPEQIADAMRRFVEDPEFLQQMSCRAHEMRRGRSWLDIADMYVDNVYTGLTGKIL